MDIPELEKALEDIPLGALRAFDTLGSTNDEALSWVDSGCPDFHWSLPMSKPRAAAALTASGLPVRVPPLRSASSSPPPLLRSRYCRFSLRSQVLRSGKL